MSETVLTGMGIGLSAAQGEVLVIGPHPKLPKPFRHQGDDASQTAALTAGISAVAKDMRGLIETSDQASAEILEALVMILEDEELFEVACEQIGSGWDAASSYANAVESFAELFKGDAAFEERLTDIRDLAKRVAASVHGISLGLELPDSGNFILVGDDFSPADTAQFTKAVVGVITIGGGPTSHTAIICRARGIPALVSCEGATKLQSGDQVLVDPVGDRVVVGGTLDSATRALSFVAKSQEPIISVRANIGSLTDAVTASSCAARGIGLFRTELLYLAASQKPTLAQQVASYTEILLACPEGPIVVRTIDAGSDKPVPFLEMPHEENPALGVRGFRLIKEHREFITEQLLALETARAATGRDVWVMAPMIATLQEAMEFSELARSIGSYKVGIMIETPAIISAIRHLRGQLDFVSVGTNDLSQYLFAADRMHAQLGLLMDHWQPALISALADIARFSEEAGIQSGVCGESASDPSFSIVLAGLGFGSVSSSPSQVGQVRAALSSLSAEQAALVAQAALQGQSAGQSKSLALEMLSRLED